MSKELPPALAAVDVTLEPGKMLGIAGPGSGKSTLLTLLLRQHDLENGTIQFGDVKIKDAILPQWRNRFAVVNQSPFCSQNRSLTTSPLAILKQQRSKFIKQRNWRVSTTI